MSTLTCLITACSLSYLTNPVILHNVSEEGSLNIRFIRLSLSLLICTIHTYR